MDYHLRLHFASAFFFFFFVIMLENFTRSTNWDMSRRCFWGPWFFSAWFAKGRSCAPLNAQSKVSLSLSDESMFSLRNGVVPLSLGQISVTLFAGSQTKPSPVEKILSPFVSSLAEKMRKKKHQSGKIRGCLKLFLSLSLPHTSCDRLKGLFADELPLEKPKGSLIYC